MTESELSAVLGGWEGYAIFVVDRVEPEGQPPQVWITLEPIPGRPAVCSGCQQKRLTIHDVEYRWIRELPILDADCWLYVARRRVACPHCGPKVEQLSWMNAGRPASRHKIRLNISMRGR